MYYNNLILKNLSGFRLGTSEKRLFNLYKTHLTSYTKNTT